MLVIINSISEDIQRYFIYSYTLKCDLKDLRTTHFTQNVKVYVFNAGLS